MSIQDIEFYLLNVGLQGQAVNLFSFPTGGGLHLDLARNRGVFLNTYGFLASIGLWMAGPRIDKISSVKLFPSESSTDEITLTSPFVLDNGRVQHGEIYMHIQGSEDLEFTPLYAKDCCISVKPSARKGYRGDFTSRALRVVAIRDRWGCRISLESNAYNPKALADSVVAHVIPSCRGEVICKELMNRRRPSDVPFMWDLTESTNGFFMKHSLHDLYNYKKIGLYPIPNEFVDENGATRPQFEGGWYHADNLPAGRLVPLVGSAPVEELAGLPQRTRTVEPVQEEVPFYARQYAFAAYWATHFQTADFQHWVGPYNAAFKKYERRNEESVTAASASRRGDDSDDDTGEGRGQSDEADQGNDHQDDIGPSCGVKRSRHGESGQAKSQKANIRIPASTRRVSSSPEEHATTLLELLNGGGARPGLPSWAKEIQDWRYRSAAEGSVTGVKDLDGGV